METSRFGGFRCWKVCVRLSLTESTDIGTIANIKKKNGGRCWEEKVMSLSSPLPPPLFLSLSSKYPRGQKTKNTPTEMLQSLLRRRHWLHVRLVWFCFAVLCYWLEKLAPLFQPMRSKTKTKRDLLARIFLRLALVTCYCFEFDCFIAFFLLRKCLVQY